MRYPGPVVSLDALLVTRATSTVRCLLGEMLLAVLHEDEQRLAEEFAYGRLLLAISGTVDDDFVASSPPRRLIVARTYSTSGAMAKSRLRCPSAASLFDRLEDVVDEFQQMMRRTQYALPRFRAPRSIQGREHISEHPVKPCRVQWLRTVPCDVFDRNANSA